MEMKQNLDYEGIRNNFDYLFNKDSQFLQCCDQCIKNDFLEIEKILEAENITELTDAKDIKDFADCCINIYIYDKAEKSKTKELESLYYKAALSQYYVEEYLSNYKSFLFPKFKNEFKQIGMLIGTFYNDNYGDENKTLIDIIKSKIEDLFKRYDFRYSYPLCCC